MTVCQLQANYASNAVSLLVEHGKVAWQSDKREGRVQCSRPLLFRCDVTATNTLGPLV